MNEFFNLLETHKSLVMLQNERPELISDSDIAMAIVEVKDNKYESHSKTIIERIESIGFKSVDPLNRNAHVIQFDVNDEIYAAYVDYENCIYIEKV